MAIPLFDGQTLFGVDFIGPTVVPEPAELQVNAYPGVHGLEVVAQGGRGAVATATVLQIASDETYLAAWENIWSQYLKFSLVRPLRDTLGVTWTHAMCVKFEPLERVCPHRTEYPEGVSRKYRITFLILRT